MLLAQVLHVAVAAGLEPVGQDGAARKVVGRSDAAGGETEPGGEGTHAVFEACARQDWEAAEALRRRFLPHEDKRDAWGPARVLHASLELAGVGRMGPIPPFVSALSEPQRAELAPVARALYEQEVQAR